MCLIQLKHVVAYEIILKFRCNLNEIIWKLNRSNSQKSPIINPYSSYNPPIHYVYIMDTIFPLAHYVNQMLSFSFVTIHRIRHNALRRKNETKTNKVTVG